MTRESAAVRGRLDDFIERHPDGWNHAAWEALLADLADAGHPVRDPDGLGRTLERKRLEHYLERLGVSGIGPKRRESLAEAFGRVWDLREADVEALSQVSGMNRPAAEALHAAMR
ncbi:MAG: helix-hairpin-helix domain-containing protein [Longimicrobiales bacterium]